MIDQKISAPSFRQNMSQDYEHKFMSQSTSMNRTARKNINRVMGSDRTDLFDEFINKLIACTDEFMVAKKKRLIYVYTYYN